MIKKKVRTFGTPEQRRMESDAKMKKEDEEVIIDYNFKFEDAIDKENSAERKDHCQP